MPHTICPTCGTRVRQSSLPAEEVERLEGELWDMRQQLELEAFQEGICIDRILESQESPNENRTACDAYEAERGNLRRTIWELEFQLGLDIRPPEFFRDPSAPS